MSGSVHIVIVNWNTGGYLRECLASIALAQRAEVTIARVTVIDNASCDDSANGLDDLPLPIELIRNSRNVGFATACNQATADSTADYLLFLNPDTRLFPDTLAAVTGFMQSEQAAGIGICGVQGVDGDGGPVISCARFPTLRVLCSQMTGLHLLLPQLFPGHQLTAAELGQNQVVDQVIGAFFFVRRDLFARLGGFDERYFLYFEEVDFALRARRQGARSYFLREARIFHGGHVSSGQVRGARLYHFLRSRLLFAHQHWPRWQANVLVVLTLSVELTARLARAGWRRDASELSAIAAAYGRLLGDLLRLGPGRDDRSHLARVEGPPDVSCPSTVGDKERPRVVHVITKLVVGGSQLTALGLCERMIRDFETHLVAGPEEGVEGSLRDAVPDPVHLHTISSLRRDVDPLRDTLAVGTLWRLLRVIRPDIVHTHGSKAGVVGRLAARGCGAQAVHTIHGWGHTPDDTTLRRAVFVGLERAMARHTDALVAVSTDVRDEGLRRGIGEPSRYVVIPELVDLDPVEPDFASARVRARAELGIPRQSVVVGWVGRFVAQKDPTTLIAALAEVLQRRGDAYAVLVGDGPLRNEVERGLTVEGVDDRAVFTGVRRDARRLYPGFDVVMHPSRWEGQPMVVQEALAERVPVVASRVAGVGELLVEGGNGYAVNPGSVGELVQRTLEVLAGERLRAPLGDDMTRHLRAVAGADRCLMGHRELYARLLGR